MKKSKITKVSKVFDNKDQSSGGSGQSQGGQSQPSGSNEQSTGAGRTVLNPDGTESQADDGASNGAGDDQSGDSQSQGQPSSGSSGNRHKDLPEDYMEKIKQGLGSAEEWNIGDVPGEGQDGSGEGQGPSSGPGETGGSGGAGGDGSEPTADRIKKMREAEKKIDEASREVLRQKSKSESGEAGKGDGSAGYGKGGLRDRLHMETLSKIDWAKIFSTRMSKYAKDKFTRLPFNRQFTGNKMLRTRISSKQPKKSQLPETNILIDTSGSISPWQAAVVMAEVKKALLTSKMKKLNVVLWTDGPYWDKSYTKITERDLVQVTKDIEDNWRSGGTSIVPVYKLMKEKGWKNKFTIIITDGYVYDRSTDSGKRIENEVLDISNTVWAILLQSRSATSSMWESLTDDLSGEKVPVFLDTDKFRQRR
jgi:hypothetical protein